MRGMLGSRFLPPYTFDRLFIWHKQTFIQELASCLGDSSVRRVQQLIHFLFTVFVCQDVLVVLEDADE
jgi:hypothetical protein